MKTRKSYLIAFEYFDNETEQVVKTRIKTHAKTYSEAVILAGFLHSKSPQNYVITKIEDVSDDLDGQ